MTKLVLFNGPPKSGKDSAINALDNIFDCTEFCHYKMTTPMDNAIKEFLSIPHLTWLLCRNEFKDETPPEFFGAIPRKALIEFSERWAKPVFGNSIFGKLAVKNEIFNQDILVGISDAGFIEELEELIKHVGEQNVLLIRVYRNNCTFVGDSRSYYDASHLNIDTKVLYNDSTEEVWHLKVQTAVKNWLHLQKAS